MITALNRKSRTPPPPYSSGTSMPRKPAWPCCGEDIAGDDPGRVPLLEVWGELNREEPPERLAERLVLGLVQRAAHGTDSATQSAYPADRTCAACAQNSRMTAGAVGLSIATVVSRTVIPWPTGSMWAAVPEPPTQP